METVEGISLHQRGMLPIGMYITIHALSFMTPNYCAVGCTPELEWHYIPRPPPPPPPPSHPPHFPSHPTINLCALLLLLLLLDTQLQPQPPPHPPLSGSLPHAHLALLFTPPPHPPLLPPPNSYSCGVGCTGSDGVQLPLGREAADGDVDAAPPPDLGQVWAYHGYLGLLPFQM